MDKEFLKIKLLDKRVIDSITNCWIWTGNCFNNGYGAICINRQNKKVNRISAFIFLDFDLDSKLLVCHKCDNRKCFNPEHLFIGTHEENMEDMKNKNRQMSGDNHYRFIKIKDNLERLKQSYLRGELDNLLQGEIAVEFDISQSTVSSYFNKWKFDRSSLKV